MAPAVMKSLLLVGVPAVVSGRTDSDPLGKVLDLMAGLAAKVTREGEAEAKAFKEYFEWCDDVNKNTAFAIKTANSQSEKLSAKIDELASEIQAGSSQIEDLASSISSSSSDLESATAIRKKEIEDFTKSESELVEAIDTLGRAVKILEREMSKNPAAFAQVANNDMTAVLNSLNTIVDAAAFSSTDKQRLSALVQAQQSTDADDDDNELGAPAAAAYKSKSGSIVDTIEDLKEKAEGQLSDLRKAETAAKNNFAMLKQSLDDQLAADNKDLAAEKVAKSAAAEGKAAAEGDLSVTKADLTSNEDSLATANQNCMQVAADHGATVKAREEELKVIAKAIQIVKESTSGAADQTYSFFQSDSLVETETHMGIHSRSDLARSEIITIVKKLARKQHSAALAQLASRIAAVMKYGTGSSEEPFAKVKVLITDMISKLEAEAAGEATEKAYCDEEMAKTASKKEELGAAMNKLTSKIDQASSRSAELKSEVKELQSELAAQATEQAEMDSIRREANADYTKAKEDLSLGLGGVRKALSVLREYYGSAAAALVQQPDMPKAHSKSGGAGQSIIGLLEVCESDFATNLAKEETEEATRLEAYETNSQKNKINKATMESDVKYKTQEHKSLDKTISEISSDRQTTSTEQSAVLEYYDQLKGRCIAKPETYEQKKQRREAEVAGLKEALSVLENETTFVQRRKHGARNMRGALMP